jgi:hypothetical protein
MLGAPERSTAAMELLDTQPREVVSEVEYRRLLGYPAGYEPGERAVELSNWARRWYEENGRPWVYLRRVQLQIGAGSLTIDGVPFQSEQLRRHLEQAGAEQGFLVAVSAGRACEEQARELWQAAKPDEYFFLEVFGSAVVERLVSSLSGRICELAEHDALMAIPHYSPGYTGWDIGEQQKMFALITGAMSRPLPEPLEVLTSGMLKPKKSLLALVGLSRRTQDRAGQTTPCGSCSFSPCQYRRQPYRFAAGSEGERPAREKAPPAAAPAVNYTVNARALRKWAQERVKIERRKDGSIAAVFRFDGTTCSNQGHPLAFDYNVVLSTPDTSGVILQSSCQPARDDGGHRLMCAYLEDAATLMKAISSEQPLLGKPLNDVLGWKRTAAPSGCHCTADSRAHKWGLALEVIHYALSHAPAMADPIGRESIGRSVPSSSSS